MEKSTVGDWIRKQAHHAEWIKTATLDEVIELVRSARPRRAPTVFTPLETERLVDFCYRCALASVCLTVDAAKSYVEAMAALPAF